MELLREPIPAPCDAGSFEKNLGIFQLTPGAVAPRFKSFESNGAVLHVQHFAQGVELRSALPAGRVVVGSIVERRGLVLRNGAPWRLNEAVAFLRGTIDVCTQASCTIAWLETEPAALA